MRHRHRDIEGVVPDEYRGHRTRVGGNGGSGLYGTLGNKRPSSPTWRAGERPARRERRGGVRRRGGPWNRGGEPQAPYGPALVIWGPSTRAAIASHKDTWQDAGCLRGLAGDGAA